jgi:hypothetical protein
LNDPFMTPWHLIMSIGKHIGYFSLITLSIINFRFTQKRVSSKNTFMFHYDFNSQLYLKKGNDLNQSLAHFQNIFCRIFLFFINAKMWPVENRRKVLCPFYLYKDKFLPKVCDLDRWPGKLHLWRRLFVWFENEHFCS